MIFPTAYWSPVSWYEAYLGDAAAEVEVWESFPKQTFRNRCVIYSPSGERIMLTVPVKRVDSKQYTRDVEISYQSNWQHQHWMAILSAYKKTPYFDYYQDYVHRLYERQPRFLLDLNEEAHAVVMSLLRNQMPQGGSEMARTEDYAGCCLEHLWHEERSVLDMLMKEGPECRLAAKV